MSDPIIELDLLERAGAVLAAGIAARFPLGGYVLQEPREISYGETEVKFSYCYTVVVRMCGPIPREETDIGMTGLFRVAETDTHPCWYE